MVNIYAVSTNRVYRFSPDRADQLLSRSQAGLADSANRRFSAAHWPIIVVANSAGPVSQQQANITVTQNRSQPHNGVARRKKDKVVESKGIVALAVSSVAPAFARDKRKTRDLCSSKTCSRAIQDYSRLADPVGRAALRGRNWLPHVLGSMHQFVQLPDLLRRHLRARTFSGTKRASFFSVIPFQ